MLNSKHILENLSINNIPHKKKNTFSHFSLEFLEVNSVGNRISINSHKIPQPLSPGT